MEVKVISYTIDRLLNPARSMLLLHIAWFIEGDGKAWEE